MEEIIEQFEKNGFIVGRLIASSKSSYRNFYPGHTVYFNANIFTLENGKVWYGDVDLTIDLESLQKIANQIKKDLYVLTEMDGRFENTQLNEEQIKEKAKLKIVCIK